MGNFKEVELDEFLTIFKLPPGGSRAEKERRIKRFMAANRGQLGRLCTCGKHTCGESDQDDNSFPPLPPKTLGSPTTISTRPQTGPNPACAKFSSHTDSNPPRSPTPASTSGENTSSASHVTPIRRPSTRTANSRYPTRGPSRSIPPRLGQSTSHSGAITEIAEDTGKAVPHHLMPQSHEQSLSLDGTGRFTKGKLPAKNLGPHIATQISSPDEGGSVQAPNPSGQQRSEEKLQGLLRHLSQESEENTRNHKRGDFENGERQSSMGKGKGKDPLSIPSEENDGGKMTRQEIPFAWSSRLWEHTFRASGYNEEKGVDSNDIGDDREILSIPEIALSEEEDEEDKAARIWEDKISQALEPGVQVVIEKRDYEDPDEFLNICKEALQSYDESPFASEFSHPDNIRWVYQGEVIC